MRRSGGALLAACLSLVAPVVATPAAAADGPVPVHDHVSQTAQIVFSISSNAAGTVYSTRDRRALLVRGALTPGAELVELGTAPVFAPWYPSERPTISGSRVAVPQAKPVGTPTTVVAWCVVDGCPAMATFTAPAGYRYLGNGDDVAVLYHAETRAVALAPWDGGEATLVPLGPEVGTPLAAHADASGVALWSTSAAAYVARPSLEVTVLAGYEPYLTPSSVVFTATVDGGYAVRRVPRATPGAAPVTELTLTTRPRNLVASESGVAWATFPEQLSTAAYGGTPTGAGTVVNDAMAPSADGTAFVAYQPVGDGSPARAMYAIAPGTTTRTLVHSPPPYPAATRSLSVSHGRVAWVDDSSYNANAFVRPFDGGTGGAETPLTHLDDVALSGPYYAGTDVSGGTVGVTFGRVGGTSRFELVGGGYGTRPYLSGRRLLLTGGSRSTLVDVRTGAMRDLGDVVAAIHGDVLVTAYDTGRITRTNLVTGTVRPVRVASCATPCAANRAGWRLAAWGDDVVYAIETTAGRSAARWSSGATTPLPMLAGGWTELAFRDGLLLRHQAGQGVHLHDLDGGTTVAVDPAGVLLPGTPLDGTLVAWRAAALRDRAGVRPLADLLPSYTPTPRHLNAAVPAGFRTPSLWRPAWVVSDDVPWQLTIRQGSATGPVVRTLSGTSARGEIAPVWDGTTATGTAAPQGTYAWTLGGGAPARAGTVYVSRTAPPAPTLTAPILASDVSTNGTFTVSWSGAPAGMTYHVERSLDGTSFVTVASTTARSMTVNGRSGATYRFRVRVVDAAGRASRAATRTTVVPWDDTGLHRYSQNTWRRSYDGRHWRGSQLRTTRPDGPNDATVTIVGDGVWLVGPTGPSYGRLQIRIDGERSYVVDAYSPVTRFRQVLFRLALPAGAHHVEVWPLATPGRPYHGVDAVAFRAPML